MPSIGQIGEQFVAEWLITQGWEILQVRWRCRWGEIDIIAQSRSLQMIAFVEVKTRQYHNWDESGVLAITRQKQEKIVKTATTFLGEYPNLAEFPCRFYVALVNYKLCQNSSQEKTNIKVGKAVQWEGYQLTLSDYLEAAF
ncbi:MAG: YraN family protein [Cyanobacteria bacterium P01_G01_bin.49]